MARQNTPFALVLPPREPGTTATRWLYDALRVEILEGRLRSGVRLPASRDLARHYGLSRGTVVEAFAMLESEGYVRGRVGSGTFVASALPDHLLETGRTTPRRAAPTGPPARRFSEFAARVRPFGNLERVTLRAFRRYMPALDHFPTAQWAQLAARCARQATVQQLGGCGPMGYRPLREAIADYLTTSRGVRCTADRVAVISGVQEALDLAARLFLDPGDRVAIEDPGYSGARVVFEAHGAAIAPVPIDEEGLTVDGAALHGARLVYVTPAHQYPLGVAMSLPRRLALLEWARSSGALIFEDDYDSEYRYSGRPLPALQGLDTAGQVLFAGTFSKVLFPSLRLGYLVVPDDVSERLARLLSVTSRHAPLIDQAVLAEFITGGHFGRHVRRMREMYAERLSFLLEYGGSILGGLLEISPIEAGLQTVGWLPENVDVRAVVRAAAERDVDVAAIDYLGAPRRRRNGLQLGFAAIDEREIRRGVRELRTVLTALDSRARAR